MAPQNSDYPTALHMYRQSSSFNTVFWVRENVLKENRAIGAVFNTKTRK